MLKMRKILGISLVLLFLLSVTVSAVSAQQILRTAPPTAKLDATKNPWYGYQARIGTKITLIDKSKGKITGKKWYVDGKLYSKSMAKKISYTTYNAGYHTFQLKVGNGATPSVYSNKIYYHFYSY